MVNKFLSLIFSKIRKEDSNFDHRIPVGYLLEFVVRKTISAFRGAVIFFNIRNFYFVERNVIIRGKNNIQCVGAINIMQDCFIDALSTNGIILGENFSLGRGSSIECSGSLRDIGVGFIAGSNIGIGSFSFFGCAGGVIIGNDTIIGNYVSLHSENHNFSNSEKPIRHQGVTRIGIYIGENCWVGAKATILDGVNIGNNCIVAAGAIVTRGTYPNFSIIGGNPAKIIGSIIK